MCSLRFPTSVLCGRADTARRAGHKQDALPGAPGGPQRHPHEREAQTSGLHKKTALLKFIYSDHKNACWTPSKMSTLGLGDKQKDEY